jgi:hypothetical protein
MTYVKISNSSYLVKLIILIWYTGGPLYMRSFYLRIRVSAIANWPFFWNLSPNLQSFLVFLYASLIFWSLSIAYNEVQLYFKLIVSTCTCQNRVSLMIHSAFKRLIIGLFLCNIGYTLKLNNSIALSTWSTYSIEQVNTLRCHTYNSNRYVYMVSRNYLIY